jgi:ribosomal protein S25
MDSLGETRRRSAALFGNEKTVEVLLALNEEGASTAQMVATRTGISYSLARDALIRLSTGGAVRQVPRVGGSRSPLYYQPAEGNLWDALIGAARAVADASRADAGQDALHHAPSPPNLKAP